MKKFVYFFLVLFLASCGSDKTASISSDATKEVSSARITAQSVLSNMEKNKYVSGELLVKFKSGVIQSSSLKTHQSLHASVIKRFSSLPEIEHVALPSGLSVRDAIIQYMSDPNVEYAEPNYIGHLDAVPNDTYFNQQWGLNNTAQFAGGTAGADIKATGAWDSSQGNSSIVMAILDSGIDYNHPDLAGNTWINTAETPDCTLDKDSNGFKCDYRGYDFTTCADFDLSDPAVLTCLAPKSVGNDPMDDLGHGTHVAGIIGAVGNNGTGISGLMWNVKLMPLKIANVQGIITSDAELAAVNYVIMMKNKGVNIKAINASYHTPFSASLLTAYTQASNASILIMASAGNETANNDLTPVYPANYGLSRITSVAATDQNDRLAAFSNFGPTSVHIAAPGVYILSTVPEAGVASSFQSFCTGSPYAGYDFCEGTSMATPHVTALSGLLFNYYTNFNADQVRATILRYVDRAEDGYPGLQSLKGLTQTGGRINAFRAVSSLLTPSNLVATAASPTTITLTWSDNATGEDGYRIERSTSGGPFVQIAQTGPNSTPTETFTDSGLDPTTTYTYQVLAFNDIGVSPNYSLTASATTPAVPPAETHHSDGGGGCSIGARQQAASSMGDIAVMLIPLVVIVLVRRKRK